MALEVYQTRWQFNFRGRACTQQFYFLADNGIDLHSYELARQIQTDLFVNTDWGFFLLGLQSQRGFLRLLSTQRRLPNYGPAWKQRFQSDLFPGRALGNLTDNFTTMNLKWQYAGDFVGKSSNRVGPLGEFALSDGKFSAFLIISANAFIAEHTATRTTIGGVNFRSCSIDRLGISNAITSGYLNPVPGRQSNRRWVA